MFHNQVQPSDADSPAQAMAQSIAALEIKLLLFLSLKIHSSGLHE